MRNPDIKDLVNKLCIKDINEIQMLRNRQCRIISFLLQVVGLSFLLKVVGFSGSRQGGCSK